MKESFSSLSDTTIGEQCVVIAGQSPKGKYYNDTGEGLPFYQGKKEFGEKFIGAPSKWTSHTTKEALEGDILMSVRAPVGPINFSTQKVCIGRGLASIRAGGNIDREFLFYALLSKQDEIKGNEGAVFASINQKQIKSIKLVLPPLSEQKRIVAILDKAFEGINQAIANAEKNLANARELFESYLNNVFTQKGNEWEEKNIADVSIEFGRGKSKHRPRNEPTLYGGKYPFIQTGDISQSNHIIRSYKQTYSEKGLLQSKLWSKGTVCIAIVGATIGETGILDFDACFPDSVIGFTLNSQLATPSYVQYLLHFFKPVIKSKGKGSARPNINLGTFKELLFPFPTIEKQNEIVGQLQLVSIQPLWTESP